MELCEGMYVRTKYGITQYKEYETSKGKLLCMPLMNGTFANIEDVLEASYDITDLIKYMDLLEIENPVKLYEIDKKVRLFNPVRCDGFTKFGDGTHCIILNLDYLVNVKDLKIKKILTREQFEENCYEVIDNEEN